MDRERQLFTGRLYKNEVDGNFRSSNDTSAGKHVNVGV